MQKNDILSKESVILQSLYEYFNNSANIDKILLIITGKDKLSLRVLDWFVTNYSKKYNIIYSINNIKINIYNNYKNKLKSYNKRFFDPFCRKNKKNLNKVAFKYNENHYILTTIGQMNFFRWCIRYNIIDYVKNHYDEIIDDMNQNKKNKKNKKNKILKKFNKQNLFLNHNIEITF